MHEAKSQLWYQLCAAAVLEMDPKRLIERLDAAEAAIHGRLRDLQYDSHHQEERQLMEDVQRSRRHLWRTIPPNRIAKVCSFEQTAACDPAKISANLTDKCNVLLHKKSVIHIRDPYKGHNE